jgi:hypothetical protein
MPIPIGCRWTAARPVTPYEWSCSQCSVVFAVVPQRGPTLTKEQIDLVNSDFEAHCKRVHPSVHPVIGLNESS